MKLLETNKQKSLKLKLRGSADATEWKIIELEGILGKSLKGSSTERQEMKYYEKGYRFGRQTGGLTCPREVLERQGREENTGTLSKMKAENYLELTWIFRCKSTNFFFLILNFSKEALAAEMTQQIKALAEETWGPKFRSGAAMWKLGMAAHGCDANKGLVTCRSQAERLASRVESVVFGFNERCCFKIIIISY